ncbi:MAG: substrate-binding domain-containing protein [Lentisphaeria bacterium]|nr:substrate-binding domain-containing protein [Lentisphaeria bacterium]
MRSAILHIAVLFDMQLDIATAIYRGVTRYAEKQGNWQLTPLPAGQETMLRKLAEDDLLDGIIAAFVSDGWAASLPRHIPMVNTSSLSRMSTMDSVTVNDHAVGELAGAHLAGVGLSRFAYVGVPAAVYSRDRRAGFDEIVRRQGRQSPVSTFDFSPDKLPSLTRWLADLACPAGVFCATDMIARRVVECCRELDLAVPGDIAVLGVGCDSTESLLSSVQLSSIMLPHQQVGQRAAELLDQHLKHPGGQTETVSLSPLYVKSAGSTARGETGKSLSARAMAILSAGLSVGMTVETVVKRLGVSRRSLELKFQRETGVSPYRWLQRQRVRRAKELLKDPALTIAEIGGRCGYPVQQQFSTFFRRETGFTPRSWRATSQPDAGG